MVRTRKWGECGSDEKLFWLVFLPSVNNAEHIVIYQKKLKCFYSNNSHMFSCSRNTQATLVEKSQLIVSCQNYKHCIVVHVWSELKTLKHIIIKGRRFWGGSDEKMRSGECGSEQKLLWLAFLSSLQPNSKSKILISSLGHAKYFY